MFYQKIFFASLMAILSLNTLQAEKNPIDLSTLDGNWHLRIMDGMEVRKARAILDFDFKQMELSGFDACNQISGTLIKNSDLSISSQLISTRMACRQSIHHYVSKRVYMRL
ncbi:MAG: META domain-containing protein [Sulfurovum sp.]|nr:META domain-containing protein [Sulfurovum sp.]